MAGHDGSGRRAGRGGWPHWHGPGRHRRAWQARRRSHPCRLRRVRGSGRCGARRGLAEGKGQRQADRHQPLRAQQAGLGRADEKQAVGHGQPRQRLHRAPLVGRIEIDQQVAAEHEVIGRFAGEQVGIDQVALQQPHLCTHTRVQRVAGGAGREIAVAEIQRAAAEGVGAVLALARARQRTGADVDGVDAKACRRHAGIEQGHGDRIGLFAGGAGQAQHAQRARAVGKGALGGEAAQRQQRLAMPEEPGLGHHHRLDQRLELAGGAVQQVPVRLRIRRLHHLAALAHRAFHRAAADGIGVQADAGLEQGLDVRGSAHAGSPDVSANSIAWISSGSRASMRTHCTRPRASWRTGPR
ncbi:hypothetical protein D9M72_272430 [compost metagenome]